MLSTFSFLTTKKRNNVNTPTSLVFMIVKNIVCNRITIWKLHCFVRYSSKMYNQNSQYKLLWYGLFYFINNGYYIGIFVNTISCFPKLTVLKVTVTNRDYTMECHTFGIIMYQWREHTCHKQYT